MLRWGANSGMVTNDLIGLRLLQISYPLKAKYEVDTKSKSEDEASM